VALSHPSLHPAAATKMIRQYSQKFVDVIDLQENTFRSLPVGEVLSPNYPALRYIAQVDEGDYLTSIRSSAVEIGQTVLTFDDLLRRTPFAGYMRTALTLLQEHYRGPVDTEFTVHVSDPYALQPKVQITLLQCRPQSAIEEEDAALPENLLAENIIFSSRRMVPRGAVVGMRHVLFVSPEGYFSLESQPQRHKLERAIGDLNKALKGETFICVGPGRWGTSTPDLGVHVAYGDIYNTRALVELSGKGIGTSPEPSFGTHFFQDLMEAKIYPLAVFLDDEDAAFNRDFFYATPNRLLDWIQVDDFLLNVLRLVRVEDFRAGHHLTLVMDDDEGRAVGFLERMRK
jgi:hypothetical protein